LKKEKTKCKEYKGGIERKKNKRRKEIKEGRIILDLINSLKFKS
jgi:hypothetical protein